MKKLRKISLEDFDRLSSTEASRLMGGSGDGGDSIPSYRPVIPDPPPYKPVTFDPPPYNPPTYNVPPVIPVYTGGISVHGSFYI